MIFILGVKNDGTNFQSRNHRAKLFVGLHLDERQQAFASPGIEADLIFLAHKVHLRPKQFDPKSFSCEGCNTISKDRITYLDLLKNIYYMELSPHLDALALKYGKQILIKL